MQEKFNQINIITFGCRLNTLESEVIRKCALKSGLSDFGKAFIFNTCAVTAEAERQVGQSVRKYRRENPDAIIILTGCSANASKEKYSDMPDVDFVVGNKEKSLQKTYDDLVDILKNNFRGNHKNEDQNYQKVFVQDLKNSSIDLNDDMDFTVENFEGRTRAFIQIQQGCRNKCAFCIVPNLRGNSVSFSKENIFSQIESVVKNGYKEIVLTGVDIASYGSKSLSANPLTDLIQDILNAFPDVKRLRLSSLDPACNYDDLIALAKIDKRIMPHFHLSLQHASDNILQSMRRRHTRKQALDLCKKLRKKLGHHIAIGADIITGFPNESDDDFKSLLRFVKQAKITHLHTFVYSARPDTFAGENMIDNVPKNIAKARAKTLRKIAEKNLIHLLKSSECRQRYVLLEDAGKSGYTENYIKCNVHDLYDIKNLKNSEKSVIKNLIKNYEIDEGKKLCENDIARVFILRKKLHNSDDLELEGIALPTKRIRRKLNTLAE